ncbi:uncharacterized protein LOC131061588 [Cryptomeria japonica]|uniref:uncharacterized protein LOC131061588 n=1 Tax=Cryptomeria japonica TaxID=3369 RepID=UPI0027DA9C1A|nr:uncharacterized protein LOC131061588 [Cryptomeria japonica]XP_057851335.2 uncharacterized protein LOC131061588 [Cryptomeria japonica]XP_057851337.2 uncharacterized protein LOC131061588 [Cryptomeria japonica]XP_057851338.2 uncharacterized protein LOC131061588 [Cryptomeria japonica]
MDSIKEAKSDGHQSQLEEANREKPLEKQQTQLEKTDREKPSEKKPLKKLLIKAPVSIPWMVRLITYTTIFVCSGSHYLLAAMKAKGPFFYIFVVSAIVVYFIVTMVLTIVKARRTGPTIVLVYLTSATYLSSLVALHTVMPSWLFTSLCFLTVALTAFHWILLLC